MSEFAGALRERIGIERRLDARDAMARGSDRWMSDGAAWASVAPLIPADLVQADVRSALPRWQVVMRNRPRLGVWTRFSWRGRYLAVRALIADPRDPDRVVMTCEEIRA